MRSILKMSTLRWISGGLCLAATLYFACEVDPGGELQTGTDWQGLCADASMGACEAGVARSDSVSATPSNGQQYGYTTGGSPLTAADIASGMTASFSESGTTPTGFTVVPRGAGVAHQAQTFCGDAGAWTFSRANVQSLINGTLKAQQVAAVNQPGPTSEFNYDYRKTNTYPLTFLTHSDGSMEVEYSYSDNVTPSSTQIHVSWRLWSHFYSNPGFATVSVTDSFSGEAMTVPTCRYTSAHGTLNLGSDWVMDIFAEGGSTNYRSVSRMTGISFSVTY